MGYRGKTREREEARLLRARAWTLQEIADHLGVSKSSVSLWVREVEFTPRPRRAGAPAARRRGPGALQRRKQDEIDGLLRDGRERIGRLTERDFLVAGTALYAGEGFKRDGQVGLANTDPALVAFFCAWLRHFFDVDESRLRVRIYLHEGLDLDAANDFWTRLTGIPPTQLLRPYRAEPGSGIRNSKHPFGCPAVTYGCSRTHRAIMGLVRGLFPAPRMNHAADALHLPGIPG